MAQLANDKMFESGSGALVIENDWYTATYSFTKGVTVIRNKDGLRFLTDGELFEHVGSAELISVQDAAFGEGKGIQLIGLSGSRMYVLLFSNLPFVIFRAHIKNSSSTQITLSHAEMLQASIDLGISLDRINAFGTNGNGDVSGYGSYCYLALVEPESRRGVVAGWISHDRGSGIVFSGIVDDKANLIARVDYGRLLLEPGSGAKLETLAVGYFDDCLEGLESYAAATKAYYNISLPDIPTVYCTWYDCGRAGTEEYLRLLTDFVANNLKQFGHNVIQIDDGWQRGQRRNGPGKVFIDVDPNGPYPNGMQGISGYIKACGLIPGIWLMPFAADQEDPFFQERMDWLVKNPDGKPWVSRWGGAGLDMSYEPARDYLRSVLHKLVYTWGFKYLKMDGLYTGAAVDLLYVNDRYQEDNLGIPQFYDKTKTPIEIYRDGLRLVRDTVGKDVFLLGCCARQNMRSFGGSIGLVDAMRIGPDNGSRLDRILRGPQYGGQTYFFHGRVWINDPDPVYVRESVPYDLAKSLASWQAISGQSYTSSDNYCELPAERLELLKRTIPNHGLLPRALDLFERKIPGVWKLTQQTNGIQRDVIALFNWDLEKSKKFSLPFAKLGLTQSSIYVGFDFWSDTFIGRIKDRIELNLAKSDCCILSLKPIVGYPQVISTSRHVSHGMVDLLEERWDSAANTLTGCSKLVGNDPYELRIVCLSLKGIWKAVRVKAVSLNDGRSLNASIKEQVGGALRIVIDSANDCIARWEIAFVESIEAQPYRGFNPLSSLEKKTAFPDKPTINQDEAMEEPTDM